MVMPTRMLIMNQEKILKTEGSDRPAAWSLYGVLLLMQQNLQQLARTLIVSLATL